MNREYTIFAVDFDGTLCTNLFSVITIPDMALISYLKKKRKQGDKLILWTCRSGKRLKKAIAWCKKFGLKFDAVNENLQEMIAWCMDDPREVFADIYINGNAVKRTGYCISRKIGKWIPCSERMPKEGQKVLVRHNRGLCPYRRVSHCIFHDGKFVEYWSPDICAYLPTCRQHYMNEVVAWQPLPELHKSIDLYAKIE